MIAASLLNSLTDIQLSNLLKTLSFKEQIKVNGYSIPVYCNEAMVIGSGAAGLRAAVELAHRDVKVTVVTSMLFAGTSACSGSDKQTIHTCATSNHGDDVINVAKSIGAGGAMDGDLAYIEAACSYLAIDGLRTYGLDLPQDRYGAILRYKTDHDEAGRATSCGPRTSRMMVKVLTKEAERSGVTLLDGYTAVKLICDDKNNCCGAVALSRLEQNETNPFGVVVLRTHNLILAGGGAGELYKDSVYPYGCVGTTGLGIEAGIAVSNIQEQQFGIGTPRNGSFPWNLSGTYMQVIPDVYSIDDKGNKKHFLSDYYRSTKEICSNIFRKGYQWPIHALRTLNYGSSLFDLAVFEELRKGNKVYLDFRHNYENKEDPFSLYNLNEDVINYLSNAKALLGSPIERLRKMNPLAIELYKQNNWDIEKVPLPFSINHQHYNGGLKVGEYAQTSIKGCYAIGESAGTHGVTRPGGAALNSGQVFAIRAAEHIKHNGLKTDINLGFEEKNVESCLAFLNKCAGKQAVAVNEIKDFVQNLMSDKCSFVCSKDGVESAKSQLQEILVKVKTLGISPNYGNFVNSFEWLNLIYEACALAESLAFYIEQDGGSRGDRIICSDKPDAVPQAAVKDLSAYGFLYERDKQKGEIIDCFRQEDGFVCSKRQVKPLPDLEHIFFEKDWEDFLIGKIFE